MSTYLLAAALMAAVVISGPVLAADARPLTSGPLTVWVADPLKKVFRSAEPPQTCPAAVEIEAARGEWESGQIVVRANQPVPALRASASPLKGPGGYQIPPVTPSELQNGSLAPGGPREGAGGICCRFVGYIRVEKNSYMTPDDELLAKAPADFPDPLLDAQAIDLPADSAQPIWLTVRVPDDAPPGQYTGTITIQGQGAQLSVPVRLTVWPFTLPRRRHVYFTNWLSVGALCRRYGVEAYSDQFWPIFEKYVANAAAHHQNVFMVPTGCIKVYRQPDGRYRFDFSIFDRWIEICRRHNAADLIEIGHLGGFASGWSGHEIKLHSWTVIDQKSGKALRVEAEELLPKLLPALQDHLRQLGLLDRSAIHIADEPSVNNIRSWREKSDWVHRWAPNIKRIDAIEAPDFGTSLEIWVPKLSHFRTWRESYEQARSRGAELWFYTCCHPCGRYPNRFIDYALIKTRILHWLNWRYRLTGYLHWGLIAWNDDPFKTATRGGLPPGDAWIVYPGPDGPLDSIRWETLRDGFEDYEYLWLLTDTARQVKEKLGPAAANFEPHFLADEICRMAVREILDYVRDPATLRSLRRQIARQIIWLRQPPTALVWSLPPTDHTIAFGPATPVLFVAAEPGSNVTVNGAALSLDDHGFGAKHLFFGPGDHTVTVEISKNGAAKTTSLTFRVRY